MGTRDPRIDAYIAKSQPFAKPILKYLRAIVHEGCPDATETIKWGFPHFEYHGLLCGIAAFKAHTAFGFWKGGRIVDAKVAKAETAMGQFGRITALEELPPKKVLVGYVRLAAKRNVEAEKLPPVPRPKTAPKPVVVPAILRQALARHAKARAGFAKLPPSHQRDYCEWIAEAKREETRAKRLTTALEWLAEGKSRNWKYERC